MTSRPTVLRSAVLAAMLALSANAFAASPSWVERSNALAKPILKEQAKFIPEMASRQGMEQFDEQVFDLGQDLYERNQASRRQQNASLQQALAKESDPHVRQDIQIMINRIDGQIRMEDLQHKLLVDFGDVPEVIFVGLEGLLDKQNPPERQARALTRLKRYVGSESGYQPLTERAQAMMEKSLAKPGLTTPYGDEIEQQLSTIDPYLKGIESLFKASKLSGWEADFAKLTKQMHAYRDWLQTQLLPKARKEVRPPAEIYAEMLRETGVDMSPEQLIDRASMEYQEVRDQMQMVANQIAAKRKLPSSHYMAVVRHLKQEQIEPTALLQTYWKRLKEIEGIIQRENLLTLPKRDAQIRLATEAEAASVPAPQMRPPRMIGNTGEYGEFLIPLTNPHAKSDAKMDDFTHESSTWTLAAHEARPGHELQFAAMVERGVSLPRALFAMNSANVEGWGLYAEAMMLPYMPPEGQLISLQLRLHRVARAFLDPMINLGKMSPEAAKHLLMEEVGLSEPMAQQEVDRYAFRKPGQATSYFYGYINMRALRTQTELALGKRFNQKAFHDFVIAQGTLPPPLLKQAVLNEFVPAQLAAAGNPATQTASAQ